MKFVILVNAFESIIWSSCLLMKWDTLPVLQISEKPYDHYARWYHEDEVGNWLTELRHMIWNHLYDNFRSCLYGTVEYKTGIGVENCKTNV